MTLWSENAPKRIEACPRDGANTTGRTYYQVPPGQESQWDGRKQFRLGATLGEAATEWAKRMSAAERPVTHVRELLERYALEVIPTKAVVTQAGDNASVVSLRKVFGDMRTGGHRAATHLQIR